MIFSKNRYPPHSASEDARERAYDARRKTRVNALMVGIML